jgi:Domain of unknown function (DUF4251)
MKTIKRSLPFFLFLMAVFFIPKVSTAQKPLTAKELAIKNLVDSQQYVFYAETVSPMGVRQRNLTSDYTVMVSKDTIISDLPYFGRAYSAPINSPGGIVFTSTDFDYKMAVRKNGGWDISIKPRDASGGQQFTLTIFENGVASLNANSNNRQSISFRGYVMERKKRK